MPRSSSSKQTCAICGKKPPALPEDRPTICGPCAEKSEILFEKEMGRIELLRTIRGQDVELYDVKHPDASTDKNHCGQVILIKAGQGFEVKICLRFSTIDWMEPLSDDETGFTSQDTRLDALIGNVSLLMESWGGGPHYMDIFDVTKVISTEGEM